MRRFLQASLLAAALAGTCSAATEDAGPAMPDALKGIPPATRVCRRDDVSASVQSVARAPDLVPDLSCAATPADVMAMQSHTEVMLVDVRPRSRYEAFRITGSVNMGVSELRTRLTLRGRTVVLVGDGKAERELYGACAGLKAQGFKQVKVLRGGVPAWQAQGGEVSGVPGEAGQAMRLNAEELWTESQFDANVVLVTRAQEAMYTRVPYAVLIPDESVSTVSATLERRRRELKGAPMAAVVLVASPATSAESLERVRKSIQPVPLLVYADGAESYARHLAQLHASWAAQARGPKSPPCRL